MVSTTLFLPQSNNQLVTQARTDEPQQQIAKKGGCKRRNRGGRETRGDFVSPPLSSPCFVLLLPNLPPPFFCCHGATQNCKCVFRRFCRFAKFGSWAFAYFCVAKLLRGLCSSCFVVSIHLFYASMRLSHDPWSSLSVLLLEFVPACHRFINRTPVVFLSTHVNFSN